MAKSNPKKARKAGKKTGGKTATITLKTEKNILISFAAADPHYIRIDAISLTGKRVDFSGHYEGVDDTTLVAELWRTNTDPHTLVVSQPMTADNPGLDQFAHSFSGLAAGPYLVKVKATNGGTICFDSRSFIIPP